MSILSQIGLLVGIVGTLAMSLSILAPHRLLLLSPAISSTVSLMWAVDEYQFLSCWTNPLYRDQATVLLPAWFKTWGQKATWVLLGSFSFSLGAGLANVVSVDPGLGETSWWYCFGLCFTLAHFLYGPKALALLARIKNDTPNGDGIVALEEWLKMHVMRALTADLPAWICYIIAATTTGGRT
jgi:hypothetical protein